MARPTIRWATVHTIHGLYEAHRKKRFNQWVYSHITNPPQCDGLYVLDLCRDLPWPLKYILRQYTHICLPYTAYTCICAFAIDGCLCVSICICPCVPSVLWKNLWITSMNVFMTRYLIVWKDLALNYGLRCLRAKCLVSQFKIIATDNDRNQLWTKGA